MADITIDAASGASATTARSPRAMVFTSATVGYFFFIDGDLDFKYMKTTDGGQTWAGPTSIFVGTMVGFDVWYDQWTSGDSGTIIHLWYFDRSADHDIHYRQLQTSDDSLGTQRTVVALTSAVAGVGAFVSGTKARGGNLYCAFDIDAGAETGTYRSTDGGATWGVRTNMVEATLDWAILFPGNESDNQDVWAIYLDASATALTLKVHDDGSDTNSESATIQTCTPTTSVATCYWPFSGSIRHSDGHLILASWSERDSATGDFQVWDINGTASITEKTALATNKDDCYHPSVFIDNTTNYIYVAYVGKRDGSEDLGVAAGVYYSRSTDGGATWDAESPYSASVTDYKSSWCPQSGLRFAVAFLDDSTNGLLSNYDNSLNLTPSTGHPTSKRSGGVPFMSGPAGPVTTW